MIARAVNAAADVIHRAQANGAQTATGIAVALESAQLLASPESVHASAAVEAERDRLKARVAELEEQLVALLAQRAVLERVDGITRRIAPSQAPREDDEFHLHHTYRVARDLPQTGGPR